MPTIRVTAQHVAVRCDADERQRLEQLCRYITRPALANERLQINAAGQVVLKLKTAWRDGTTRFANHGVLGPNAKLRAMVVPHGPAQAIGKSEQTPTEPGCAHDRPARICWARLRKRVLATT